MMPVFEKIRGFLFDPSQSFRKVRDEGAAECVWHLLALAVFYGVMSTIMDIIGVFSHPVRIIVPLGSGLVVVPILVVVLLITIVVVALLAAVGGGLWLHAWAYLFGARKGVWQTEKVLFYGLTPFFLIGWVHAIGFVIGMVWAAIVAIMGLKELQNLTESKAALAVVLSIVIAGALLYLFAGPLVVDTLSAVTSQIS